MTRTLEHKFFIVMYMVMQSLFLFVWPSYASDGVFIEEMTAPEIRKKIDSGATTAIIPTGGSEQNGPHMVIGKHNYIVAYTAGEIAKKLGNALVTPVVTYVPEGNIEPAQGHMQFAGTLSVSEETYAALLTDIVKSLKQHGFKFICFIGDSGGNQAVQKKLADLLTAKWKDSGVRVLQVSDYYDNNGQDAWVSEKKIAVQNPSAHAGFEDSSELMAVYEKGVRKNLLGMRKPEDFNNTGAMGDSTLASAEYGKYLLKLKIDAAVNQIKNVK